MKKTLPIVMLLVAGCSINKKQDAVQVCIPGFKPATISQTEMLDTVTSSVNDPRTVTLLPGKFVSPVFPEAKSVADSALHIASVLLSSVDFKGVMTKLDFTCRNYGNYCAENCNNRNDRLTWQKGF